MQCGPSLQCGHKALQDVASAAESFCKEHMRGGHTCLGCGVAPTSQIGDGILATTETEWMKILDPTVCMLSSS